MQFTLIVVSDDDEAIFQFVLIFFVENILDFLSSYLFVSREKELLLLCLDFAVRFVTELYA